MSVVRKWNLNEAEGRYAATNILEPEIEMQFGLKRKNGKREHVGRFSLNLEKLADEGFVTRRELANNRVFDIQIYRDATGTYLLGVRSDHTTPLSQYELR